MIRVRDGTFVIRILLPTSIKARTITMSLLHVTVFITDSSTASCCSLSRCPVCVSRDKDDRGNDVQPGQSAVMQEACPGGVFTRTPANLSLETVAPKMPITPEQQLHSVELFWSMAGEKQAVPLQTVTLWNPPQRHQHGATGYYGPVSKVSPI